MVFRAGHHMCARLEGPVLAFEGELIYAAGCSGTVTKEIEWS